MSPAGLSLSGLCCGCGGRWRVFGLETFSGVPAAGSDAWAATRQPRWRAWRGGPFVGYRPPGPGPRAAMAGAYRPPVVALAHARPRRAAGSPREANSGSGGGVKRAHSPGGWRVREAQAQSSTQVSPTRSCASVGLARFRRGGLQRRFNRPFRRRACRHCVVRSGSCRSVLGLRLWESPGAIQNFCARAIKSHHIVPAPHDW